MDFMMRIYTKRCLFVVTVAGLLCGSLVLGCNQKSSPVAVEEVSHDDHDDHAGHDHAPGEHDSAAHDHSGWWCNEHGVPEEECALCDTSLIAAFKAEGDWCDEHNRPDSQCFIDHPENFAKFASRYEAKYGKQPPQPTE